MRASRILLPALALLSAGLLTGATLSIGATADRVEVWKTDLYGQSAALEGLEVTLPAEAERQLFWTTAFPAGAPEEAETEFSVSLLRRESYLSDRSNWVSVEFWDNGGRGYNGFTEEDLLSEMARDGMLAACGDALRALMADTPAGEERKRVYALSDLTEFYPLEVDAWFESSIYFGDKEDWLLALFRDYFAVPVLPDSYVTITVEKWEGRRVGTQGTSENWANVDVEFDSPWYLGSSCWSAEDGESAVLFALSNTYENQEAGGEIGFLDGSRIPGGWGIYRFTLDEDRAGGTLETVWSLPEGAAVVEFWGDEDLGEFYLLTREEDTLRLRVFDRDMALTQVLDLLPYPADAHYMQTFKGDGFLVPMEYVYEGPEEDRTAVYHFAVAERTEAGWRLAFTADNRAAAELGHGDFTWTDSYGSQLDMAFDGERLAIRDQADMYSSYSGEFTLAVYTAGGLEYLGLYDCSLFPRGNTDQGRYSYCQFPWDWTDPLVEWTRG